MFGLNLTEVYIAIGLILCIATMFNIKNVERWGFGLSISLIAIWPFYIVSGIVQIIQFYLYKK